MASGKPGGGRKRYVRKGLRRYWHPKWEGSPYQQYAAAWVRKQHWRVRQLLPEREDAMSECALVFAKCVDRYMRQPEQSHNAGYGTVNNPKWFMALYKRALSNWWIRLQDRESKMLTVEVPGVSADEILTISHDVSDTERVRRNRQARHAADYIQQQPDGPFSAALRMASGELRTILSILATAPQEAIDELTDGLGGGLLSRKNSARLNSRVARMCGTRQQFDFVAEFRALVA